MVQFPRFNIPSSGQSGTPSWATGGKAQTLENEWERYRRVLQAAGAPGVEIEDMYNYPGYTGGNLPYRPAPTNVAQATQAVATRPTAQTPTGPRTAGQRAAQAERIGPAGVPADSYLAAAAQEPSPQQPFTPTAPGPGDGTYAGAPFTTRPGRFYSDYEQLALTALAEDPAAITRAYAGHFGYGPRTADLLNQWTDPMSLLRALNYDAGFLNDPQNQLDAISGIYDIALGRAPGTENTGAAFNSRQIMQNIIGSRYTPGVDKPNSMAQLIGDPSRGVDENIQNTIGIILTSLQGILPNQTLNAYASVLQDAAEEYKDFTDRNPQAAESTFNEFLSNRYGPYGGLF